MKKSACLLVSSLTHPARLLTLRRNPQMLAASVRSVEHASQAHPQVESSIPSPPTPPPPATPNPATTSQQLLTAGIAQHQHEAHQALAPSQSQEADPSEQVPDGSSAEQQDMLGLESREGLQRQMSLDAAKEQHVHRSWSMAGNRAQLQGKGPVVDATTIPARGTNAAGVSAQQLHISVRRHYKEKGKLGLPFTATQAAAVSGVRTCVNCMDSQRVREQHVPEPPSSVRLNVACG